MALPPRGPCHLIHSCALGSPQHGNHRVLLRRALSLGWLRLRQGLDRRPQLIDQRPAVANLPPFLDTRESIPQRQQTLAAEWRGKELPVRSDGNLTLIHGGRGFAAQPDSVIADDVDAHGWVLLTRIRREGLGNVAQDVEWG